MCGLMNGVTNFKPMYEPRPDVGLRVMLYSHDSVGLGHLRRNLAIAGAITKSFSGASAMIVTGSPCATQFELPASTDLIKIPSITKNDDGHYITGSFGGSLETTLRFRSRMMLETYRAFSPDLIIIDHQPTGLKGEAMATLKEAKANGTKIFFGMRDVVDSPDVVRRDWDNADCHWALNQCYDQICVYGKEEIFDSRVAYDPLLGNVKRCEFVGFIVPSHKVKIKKNGERKKKRVLVTFGGGNDGAQRVEHYLKALTMQPVSWDSHVVTGPMMSPDMVRRLKEMGRAVQPADSVSVKRFHRNLPSLMPQFDAIVSMAGYNSCAEILQSGVPAIFLPRSFPRQEQLIRAVRLAQRGWAITMPQERPDPHCLIEVIETAINTPRTARTEADLDGLRNLSALVGQHLGIEVEESSVSNTGNTMEESWDAAGERSAL
jgi:predicted glycosyltransferase